jgi:hypothetical protein
MCILNCLILKYTHITVNETVLSQEPNHSILWDSPGISDPQTLWEGALGTRTRSPDTRSGSVPPSPLQVITNIVGTARNQSLKLPFLLGTGLGVQ